MCETCDGIEVITGNNLGGAGYFAGLDKEAGKYHVSFSCRMSSIVFLMQ